jgi:hypothetical protein
MKKIRILKDKEEKLTIEDIIENYKLLTVDKIYGSETEKILDTFKDMHLSLLNKKIDKLYLSNKIKK